MEKNLVWWYLPVMSSWAGSLKIGGFSRQKKKKKKYLEQK
jgi:hypothetical protein